VQLFINTYSLLGTGLILVPSYSEFVFQCSAISDPVGS